MRRREAANTGGVMVAVIPPADVAARLAQPDGEPLEQLHITLAYLGDAADLDDAQRQELIDTVAAVTATVPPAAVTVSGLGRFDQVDEDGNAPIVALVDSRDLTDLHAALVEALTEAGLPVNLDHGFTAHMTLAYAPPDTPLPDVSGAEFTADQVTVFIGGDRTDLPLGGTMPRSSEALPGGRTYVEIRELLEDAITTAAGGGDGFYCWVKDLTDEWVVYELEGKATTPGTFKATYTVSDQGAVTLGTAEKVEARTSYETVTEAVKYEGGRVLEAKGTDDAGGRVFRVQIIEAGMSKNGRAYPMSVLRESVSLYAGAKAYDHHRTGAELETSTINGLVGHYRAPAVNERGIEADLHLLPSAVQTAEALDASLAAQTAGLAPLVGISHDVACSWRPVVQAGTRFNEATKIDRVFSADVVADPAAGGRAIRSVAGGITTDIPEEGPMTQSIADLVELAESATAEDKAKLAAALGISGEPATTTTTTPPAPAAGSEGGEGAGELVGAGAVERDSILGKMILRERLKEAKLEHLETVVQGQLPERITEADVTRVVESALAMTGEFEKAGLVPTHTSIQVGVEELDKKKLRLDNSLKRNWQEGYTSIRQAYVDITGFRGDTFDPEFGRQIIRESHVDGTFGRARESVDTTSWGEILGDSINRRLMELYRISRYSDWRKVVRTKPVNDFRTQHVIGWGGYGDLPTVPQGAPYQPLTSPADEEATYVPSKRGGTEDITWETILADDLGAIAKIPESLSLAAARTLYKFVMITLLTGNPTIYDAVALFAAGHNNTTAVALGTTGLTTLRQKMRDQTDRGANNVIGLVPNVLIVPNELEQTAYELTESPNKVTSNEDGTVPNFNKGRYEVIVVDDLTDANDWFALDNTAEGIELAFLGGKEDPELFVQDDPKVGAVFNADKVTYKIRHVYGGAVTDFRPFQRATQ